MAPTRPAIRIWRTLARAADTHPAAIIFAVAVVVNAAFLWVLFASFEVRLGTYEYRDIARHLSLGKGFALEPDGPPILWRPPLYVFVLAAVYALFGDEHLPVVVFQLLMNAGACVALFEIGRRVFDRRTAFLGALAVSLHPLVLYNTARVMTETLFTLLLALTVLLCIELFEHPPRGAVWLGMAMGLASLCRAAFQFFPLVVLGTVLLAPRDRRGAFFRGALVATGVMALTVAPWTLRNYVVSGGDFIVIDTSGGYTLWVGNSVVTDGQDDDGMSEEQRVLLRTTLAGLLNVDPASADVINGRILEMAWSSESNRLLFRQALREMAAHPLDTAVLWIKKFFRFWFSLYREENRSLQAIVVALQLLVLGPGAVGLVLRAREEPRALPLIVAILYMAGLHTAVAANVRHSVPILPYFVLAGVYAVGRIAKRQAHGHDPSH